jgi:hypothetical protein
MAITITLNDKLVAGLEGRAKKHQLSVEELALRILIQAAEESETATPQEAVAKIQAAAPNHAHVTPATASLADLLRASPGDPCFDLETWKKQWSVVEAELKAITRANDVAENRGG